MHTAPTTSIGLAALALFVLLAAAAAGIALVRRRYRLRRAAALRRDDEDFDLVFPEGPNDRPVRKTTAGRRIARR